jgi:transglutaminase-like putative cysteine protease
MRYAITHTTRFRYAFPVRFARCNLRLKPITWDGQTVVDHALAIEPTASADPGRDSGYPVNATRIVVKKPATELRIESRAHVVVDRIAPVPLEDDVTVAEAGQAAREARDIGDTAPANYLFPSPLIAAFPEIAARRGRGRARARQGDQVWLSL